MQNLFYIFICFAVLAGNLKNICAQTKTEVKVPLKVEKLENPVFRQSIFVDKTTYEPEFTKTVLTKTTKVPGDILVKAERIPDKVSSFYIWVDTNKNGSLEDEKPLTLDGDSSVEFNIEQKSLLKNLCFFPTEFHTCEKKKTANFLIISIGCRITGWLANFE